MTETVMQITAKHFCAGLILEDDVVVRTAPILHYMAKWTKRKVTDYCDNKKWTYKINVYDSDSK